MNYELISRYLVYLRQEKKWTQEELANNLQISRQAVSKWETGGSLPDLEILLKLSKLYKITMNEILEPSVKKYIDEFEEIDQIDQTKLKDILLSFQSKDLVKAYMGTSPAIHTLLKLLFADIDFDKECTAIGSVRVHEIEDIHTQIVSMVNICAD